MQILVTGATGFIGHHLVQRLVAEKHQVTIVTRSTSSAKRFIWYDAVQHIEADVAADDLNWLYTLPTPDLLMHLAWSGLPHFKSAFHIDKELPAQQRFLLQAVESGIDQLLVTGTCLEYGMQSGCLSETHATQPHTAYGIAKDRLRIWLESLQQERHFDLQWVRLFYMYGEGQNPKSLIPQLQQAIDNGVKCFNMSGGEQLRDYLPVETVANYLLEIGLRQKCSGIINLCSGKPIRVIDLVRDYLLLQNASMELNLGYYPYADYEPMDFWGDADKLNICLSQPKDYIF